MTAAEKLSVAPGSPMVEFALDYARRGWPVFPCRPTNKTPYFKGGHNSASTDPETIRRWWTEFPRAMIGVPMGSRSGVWAIDPDPPKKDGEPDGRVVWAELVEKHGKLPPTHTEVTPRGGQHILFAWDAQRPVTNSPGALKGQNIDVRGEGGYVIVAPSISVGDGGKNVAGEYCFVEPLLFFSFATAPDWLYEMVLQPEPQAAPAPVVSLNFNNAKRQSSRLFAPDEFWRKVNSLALDKLGSWVTDIFPHARFEQGTGAYRISSRDLGRDPEEDLSIASNGIVDFGVADMGDPRLGKRTPIDIVIEHGGKREPKEAALWLCDRCGVDPATLGWRAESKRATAEAVIAETAQIDNGTITQDGIARVFARQFEDQLRFCHHAGAWYEWTGTHWKKDETSIAFQYCRELGRQFSEGAKASEVKEVRKISFAGGVEKFARSDRTFAVTSETWDRDPFLLGTPAGTVDLRTGKLREPDPRDGITKVTAVAPADTGDCPRFLQFLKETFGEDDELIRFAQQWAGYCLTGDTREHALVFGFGNGKNGKSVWLNTLTGILNDYAVTAAMETFTASTGNKHPTDLAMLRGARLVTASETEEGQPWAEARIKQLTGGDKISARFMRQDFFTFKPSFKLTIIGNHKPVLKNVDDAARRRFNLIPFNRVPAKPDPLLEQKLKAEWPGILRWFIEGCLNWQANGLIRPESLIKATESYFEDQDLLAQWLAEACDAEPGNRYKWESVGLLFGSWSEYATRAGEKPGSAKAWGAELAKRGYERDKVGGVRCFRGLMLRTPPAKKLDFNNAPLQTPAAAAATADDFG
jgi:putative DNA primase/helicase